MVIHQDRITGGTRIVTQITGATGGIGRVMDAHVEGLPDFSASCLVVNLHHAAAHSIHSLHKIILPDRPHGIRWLQRQINRIGINQSQARHIDEHVAKGQESSIFE